MKTVNLGGHFMQRIPRANALAPIGEALSANVRANH